MKTYEKSSLASRMWRKLRSKPQSWLQSCSWFNQP
jgi:hypothetical protein